MDRIKNKINKIAFILIDFSLISIFAIFIGIPYIFYKKIFSSKVLIDNGRSVTFLIHGTGVSSFQWYIARFYLDLCGKQNVVVDYNYNQKINKSFSELIEHINDKIKDIVKDDQNQTIKLIFIGHSQGGLHARLLYNYYKYKKEEQYIDKSALKAFILNAPQNGIFLVNLINEYSKYVTTFLTDTFKNKFQVQDSKNDMEENSEFIAYYRDYCRDCCQYYCQDYCESETSNTQTILDEIYEVTGKNDFVDPDSAIWKSKEFYQSYFGHYFCAVNPYLWFRFIIPKLDDEKKN